MVRLFLQVWLDIYIWFNLFAPHQIKGTLKVFMQICMVLQYFSEQFTLRMYNHSLQNAGIFFRTVYILNIATRSVWSWNVLQNSSHFDVSWNVFQINLHFECITIWFSNNRSCLLSIFIIPAMLYSTKINYNSTTIFFKQDILGFYIPMNYWGLLSM